MLTTDPLLVGYASAELALALYIALSNSVVILVYIRARHIRTPTNMYIFSLAITDFLAGALGIPLTVVSVLTKWPGAFLPCLTIHLILCMLCTISTFHLLAMALDKYLSICMKKFDQHRPSSGSSSRKSRAHILVLTCWLSGSLIGGLPLMDGFGFATRTFPNFTGNCNFTDVVDYRYLVFVIFFGTIIMPSVLIAYCYIAIYAHIRHEERQIKCLLRASERQRRINARRKLIRIMLILVMTYMVCWYPLYLINTADLFLHLHAGRPATLAAVVLSHVNCALNPLIYAYGVPGFKQSLRRFLPAFATANFSTSHQQATLATAAQQWPGDGPWRCRNGVWAKESTAVCRTAGDDTTRKHRLLSAPPVNQQNGRMLRTMHAVPPETLLIAAKPSVDLSLLASTGREQKCRNPSSLRQQNSTESTMNGPPLTTTVATTTIMSISEENSSGTNCSSSQDPIESGPSPSSPRRHSDAGSVSSVPKPKESLTSRLSSWSVRLFQGQWLIRRMPEVADAEPEPEDRTALLLRRKRGMTEIGRGDTLAMAAKSINKS